MTSALKELGWSSVSDVLLKRDIAAIGRLLSPTCDAHALTEQLLCRSVPSVPSVRQTRAVASGQLQLPRARTEFARRNYMYRAISARNLKVSSELS